MHIPGPSFGAALIGRSMHGRPFLAQSPCVLFPCCSKEDPGRLGNWEVALAVITVDSRDFQ